MAGIPESKRKAQIDYLMENVNHCAQHDMREVDKWQFLVPFRKKEQILLDALEKCRSLVPSNLMCTDSYGHVIVDKALNEYREDMVTDEHMKTALENENAHLRELFNKVSAENALLKKQLEAPTPAEKMMGAGLDHPCKDKCSGWMQGYERGQFDLRATVKEHECFLTALEVIARNGDAPSKHVALTALGRA